MHLLKNLILLVFIWLGLLSVPTNQSANVCFFPTIFSFNLSLPLTDFFTKFMQKMFVVMPPQKKKPAAEVVKESELHEVQPLKANGEDAAAVNA